MSRFSSLESLLRDFSESAERALAAIGYTADELGRMKNSMRPFVVSASATDSEASMEPLYFAQLAYRNEEENSDKVWGVFVCQNTEQSRFETVRVYGRRGKTLSVKLDVTEFADSEEMNARRRRAIIRRATDFVYDKLHKEHYFLDQNTGCIPKIRAIYPSILNYRSFNIGDAEPTDANHFVPRRVRSSIPERLTAQGLPMRVTQIDQSNSDDYAYYDGRRELVRGAERSSGLCVALQSLIRSQGRNDPIESISLALVWESNGKAHIYRSWIAPGDSIRINREQVPFPKALSMFNAQVIAIEQRGFLRAYHDETIRRIELQSSAILNRPFTSGYHPYVVRDELSRMMGQAVDSVLSALDVASQPDPVPMPPPEPEVVQGVDESEWGSIEL